MSDAELPIIRKVYDFILWYTPILNKLPRDHKFALGDLIIRGLHDLLEQLLIAQYEHNKLNRLVSLNSKLDILRYQTRMLFDLKLFPVRRYDYAGQQLYSIGSDLGGWIKQQRQPRK